MGKETVAIGVRFHYELKDTYLGQLGTTCLPHMAHCDLLVPGDDDNFGYVRCLRGLLYYLRGLVQVDDAYVDGGHLSAWSVVRRGLPRGILLGGSFGCGCRSGYDSGGPCVRVTPSVPSGLPSSDFARNCGVCA